MTVPGRWRPPEYVYLGASKQDSTSANVERTLQNARYTL